LKDPLTRVSQKWRFSAPNTFYSENKIYRVEEVQMFKPSFQLLPDDKITEVLKKKKPKILKDGDRVIFKGK
jgi:hypothetical protein